MSKRTVPVDRGHRIPAPPWWMVAIGKVRDSMTDQEVIDAIEQQTGRRYSKFTLSRYFKADDPTTTLELTEDLWATFGRAHGIPRPVVIAATRAEAERLSPGKGDPLDQSMDRFDAELQDDEEKDQGPVLPSARGEKHRRAPGAPAAGGVGASRRRH